MAFTVTAKSDIGSTSLRNMISNTIPHQFDGNDGEKCGGASVKRSDMQAGSVKFEGAGPYYLRAVDHATASALGNTIQLTLYASVEERGQSPVQIETQMTPRAAELLANTLLQAAKLLERSGN